jgi:hypothetical protein
MEPKHGIKYGGPALNIILAIQKNISKPLYCAELMRYLLTHRELLWHVPRAKQIQLQCSGEADARS